MARESSKQRWLLAIISAVAAIGGLLFGYDTGVISGAILYIKQDYALSTFQEELIISMVSLGAIFGALVGGPLCDKLGRKKVVLASSLVFIISAIGLSLSDGVNQLIFWRLIVGFAIGISSTTAPLYIAELSPRSIRGGLVTINQLFITIGILASYLIGLVFVDTQSWRIMFAIAMIPAAIQFIVMAFFPESPRYLANIGEKTKALSVLKRFRGAEDRFRNRPYRKDDAAAKTSLERAFIQKHPSSPPCRSGSHNHPADYRNQYNHLLCPNDLSVCRVPLGSSSSISHNMGRSGQRSHDLSSNLLA